MAKVKVVFQHATLPDVTAEMKESACGHEAVWEWGAASMRTLSWSN